MTERSLFVTTITRIPLKIVGIMADFAIIIRTVILLLVANSWLLARQEMQTLNWAFFVLLIVACLVWDVLSDVERGRFRDDGLGDTLEGKASDVVAHVGAVYIVAMTIAGLLVMLFYGSSMIAMAVFIILMVTTMLLQWPAPINEKLKEMVGKQDYGDKVDCSDDDDTELKWPRINNVAAKPYADALLSYAQQAIVAATIIVVVI